MKKKVLAALAAVCCLFSGMVMPVSAEETILESDKFTWTSYRVIYPELNATLKEVTRDNPDYEITRGLIVTGMYSDTNESEASYYMLTSIEYLGDVLVSYSGAILATAEEVEAQLQEGSEMPVIGDILACNALYLIACGGETCYPGELVFPDDKNGLVNLGHGTALFGQEYSQVIHHYLNTAYAREQGWEPCMTSADILYGDINDNDSVDIVDVIVLNKNLLTGYTVNDYGQLAADVDHNGIVNATDSLNILKYVVGIIDDFETLS